MKSLGGCANIIPVVAKSDTMSEGELKSFKAQVRRVWAGLAGLGVRGLGG